MLSKGRPELSRRVTSASLTFDEGVIIFEVLEANLCWHGRNLSLFSDAVCCFIMWKSCRYSLRASAGSRIRKTRLYCKFLSGLGGKLPILFQYWSLRRTKSVKNCKSSTGTMSRAWAFCLIGPCKISVIGVANFGKLSCSLFFPDLGFS